MKEPLTIADEYKPAITLAVVQQAIVLLLAALILDGGQIGQMCIYALFAFWTGVGVIISRRRLNPTKLDLILVRVGYLALCAISFILTQSIWHWRGF